MNLSEDDESHWYSDGDVALWFPDTRIDDEGDNYGFMFKVHWIDDPNY